MISASDRAGARGGTRTQAQMREDPDNYGVVFDDGHDLEVRVCDTGEPLYFEEMLDEVHSIRYRPDCCGRNAV